MNINDYTCSIPRPNKKDFTATYWYKGGRTIAWKSNCTLQKIEYVSGLMVDLITCVSETVLDAEAFGTARAAYSIARNSLSNRFKADLFRELGIENNPKRELFFQTCATVADVDQEDFFKIYEMAEQLVDLIV